MWKIRGRQTDPGQSVNAEEDEDWTVQITHLCRYGDV